MPLSANEIKEYRAKVVSLSSDNKESALKFIIPFKPFTIVPVLHNILVDGIEKSKNTPDAADALKFFTETVTLMGDLKDRLERYEKCTNIVTKFINLGSILEGLTPEKTEADLKAFMDNIAKVVVTADMLDLYQEAATWLEGWHLHTKSMYSKSDLDPVTKEPKVDAAGIYPVIDKEDRVFRRYLGKSQYLVSTYYRDAANMLRTKIDALQAADLVTVQHDNGRATISVVVESTNALLIEKITNAMKGACQAQVATPLKNDVQVAPVVARNQEDTERGWRGIFGYISCSQNKEEATVDQLMRRFRTYGLTDEQKQVLGQEMGNLKEAINGRLDQYLSSSYGGYGLAWLHTHAAVAEAAKKEISNSVNPAELPEILYKLRGQLIRGNSNSLLPIVNNLLLEVFDVLRIPFEAQYAQAAGMQLR